MWLGFVLRMIDVCDGGYALLGLHGRGPDFATPLPSPSSSSSSSSSSPSPSTFPCPLVSPFCLTHLSDNQPKEGV